MKLSPDQIIDGKYRIVRCLGQGGMGAVFLGEHTRIGRKVAIKVLHADLAGQSTPAARFQMEAQLTTRVGSAHIVDVLDMGDLADGHCFLVMEYLEGETLSERLEKRGSLSANELSGLVVQVLDGLGKAHEARVIHRDMKPDNIFLIERDGRDFVKLLDFGVSKFLEDTQRRGPCLTVNGTLVGTPQYMSPEQARGLELDARADLYALGVVMYECLAGDTPFSGDNVQDLLFRVALEEAPRLDPAILDVDPGFIGIIHKAMARAPQDRFQSAEEFRLALLTWRESQGLEPEGGAPGRPSSGGAISGLPSGAFAHSVSLGDGTRPSGTPANWSTPTAAVNAPVSSATLESQSVTRSGQWRRALPLAAAAALLAAGLFSARSLHRSAASGGPPESAQVAPLQPNAGESPAAADRSSPLPEVGVAGGPQAGSSISTGRGAAPRAMTLAGDRSRASAKGLAASKPEHAEELPLPSAASAPVPPPAASVVQAPSPEVAAPEVAPVVAHAPAAPQVSAPVAPTNSARGYKGRKFRTEL